MKQKNYQRWSRPLLLTLLSIFMAFSGASSAWSQVTEGFEYATDGTTPISVNDGNMGLSNGWVVVGSGSYVGITTGTSKDLQLKSGSYVYAGTYSIGTQYANSNTWLVCPVEVSGNLKFYARRYDSSRVLTIGIASKSGDVYTIENSSFASYTSELGTEYTEFTVNLGDDPVYVAFQPSKAFFDNVTYIPYQAASGPGFAVKDGSTKLTSPYAYNFGLATAGTTKTFKLTNPGTEATPISVDVTGANGFTAAVEDNATSIPADGEKTLTITMPNATASGSIVVTPTGDGLSAFTFNVSGTVRNPNKVYLDFAGGTMPDGWTSVQTGSSSSYSWTAATGYIGTSSTSSSYTHAFTSPKLIFAKDEVVMFKTARYNNKDWYDDPYTSSIAVQYSTDGSEWTTIGSAFTDDLYGSWTQRSVTIPVEGVKYIRFNGYDVCLTEIYGGQEIARPKNVTITGISATGATIGWTAFGSEANWQVSYSTSSGNPAGGTLVNADSNSKAITGLSALTTYYVSVRIDNGGGDYGEWSDESSFTTKVAPVSAYPYTENFNSLSSNGQIPEYWDNSEGTTTDDSYKWSYNTSYGSGHEGKCVRFDSYSNNNGKTNFLKTRPFNFTEGQPMKLSFWYKNPAGGDFSVYVSTDGGTTYPTEIATGLTGKSDWTQKEIDIPAAVYGNNVVVVFKGTSNYGSGDARIYLDDVTISEVSAYSMSVSGGDVSENTIAFGTVKNTTTTKTFTINNDGSNDLTSVSVVSSDNTVFTVSETGFNIAAGESKDITVTFVKAVDGDYSKTITISQANVATPIVLTATATYQTPTPATMEATLDEAAIGASVDFGTVNKATVKTFKVTNTGEATLNATITITGTDAAKFTPSTTSLVVAGESNETFTITFNSDDEDVAKTATVTLSAAGLPNVSFDVTGTYSNFWTEDFNDASGFPTGWTGGTWAIDTNSGYENKTKMALAPSSSTAGTMVTPRLSAKVDDVLTWDAYFKWADEPLIVEYSNDEQESWTPYITIYGTASGEKGSGSVNYHKEMSFTAPANGNYYLRFTSTYSNGVDNFSGFKLNPKTHDAIITSKSIPATGSQYVEYTAYVTVNELLGKNDEVVTAELWIGSTKVATESDVTLNASASKVIYLTFTPDEAISGDAVIKVYNGDNSIDLTSDVQAVEINAALVLDETVNPEAVLTSTGDKPSVVVKYNAKNGWNTICMPFALTDGILTSIFGTGWKAYEFKSYSADVLGFNSTTMFAAGYPYIIYIETAASHPEGVTLFNVDVTVLEPKSDIYSGATFQGTYAPKAAGSLTDNYGVTTAGKIVKANASASMKGFRGYFTGLPTNSSARLSFEDDATGITTIIDAKELNNDGKVYNLNGQRVENAHKGLYIVNGRKVVVK